MPLKGKKIACFVALPHHTRFLYPIMELAETRGAQSLFFTTLSDYPFERDLLKQGRECKLLQSYADQDMRFKKKKMLDDFFKVWAQRCFAWDGYRHWPFVLQASLLSHGFEEFLCLDKMIAAERPDILLSLHERNRWGKLLGYYSRKYKIPYVTLQEGDYYEDRLSFSGHTEYSTALLLWGEETKQRLVRLKSAKEKIINIGNTHLQKIGQSVFDDTTLEQARKELNIPRGKKIVLFLMGIQWGMVNDRSLWVDMLQQLEAREDIVALLKWHPKIARSSYDELVKEVFAKELPSCICVQNHDPYSLLALADYCVTLGNTTLAVEALSFGKPLFSLPGLDKQADRYAQKGVAIALGAPGQWDRLFAFIEHGPPQDYQRRVDTFLAGYFYKNNNVAAKLALKVIEHISSIRDYQHSPVLLTGASITGRLSVIIPAGDDTQLLFASLTGLSEKLKHADWEAVIVVNGAHMEEALQAISGDVRMVQTDCKHLADLFNVGAAAACGEIFVFTRPGLVFVEGEKFFSEARNVVTALPIKDVDGAAHCLGYAFDFNCVPQPVTDYHAEIDAVGGGFLAIAREHFQRIGGFDNTLPPRYLEVDLCLAAKAAGIACRRGDGAVFCLHDSYLRGVVPNWQQNIAFFSKWVGELPKSEDYLGFAKEMLDV